MRTLMTTLAATLILIATAQANPVMVSATGSVVFNGVTTPPLSGVTSGQRAIVSFMVDSNNFVEGVPGDTRGYPIDQASFWLSFSGGVAVGLLDPFPAGETPYFSLVEGFPVSDGFFISTSPVSPGGVPLAQSPLEFNLDLGYDGATLGSLDILAARGTYDFGGLTRFSFNLWQVFPDNVRMEIDFENLTIADAPVSVEPTSWGRVKALFN